MVHQQAAILRPETLIEEFRKNGVTHVVTIPDSETNYLYELMEGQDWLDIVPVSREGEAYGTALDAGFPLVMVVGYRGWTRRGVIRDSVAKYTEPFLNAFGINYYLVEQNEDGDRISIAFEEARTTNGPVAVLVGDEYHGFNR